MILSLKTAGPVTELELINAQTGQPHATETWESGRQLADQLLGRIHSLLQAQSAEPSQLAGIIVFAGPGSFTSLRIGHATANALADGLHIPIANATGDDWQAQALGALANRKPGVPVLPHYGGEANITSPKS